MKILIVTTLLISCAVTATHQKQLKKEQRRELHRAVAEAGRLWGAREEAKYWKGMARRMVWEVECIPLVGGKENRRFNRPDDPTTIVNDPGAYWYS